MATTQTLAHNRAVILETLRAELPHLRQAYGVTRLAIYGSVARDEAGPNSDVDLLVALANPLGLKFVELALYLEKMLGRRVSLATFDSFRRTIQKPHRQYLSDSIQEDLLYVEAPT